MSLEVNMNTQTKRAITKYTLEIKQDVTRLVNEKDYAHQQVVDHLGITFSAIGYGLEQKKALQRHHWGRKRL